MNKLEQKAKRQKTSRNNRRFLTRLDMAIIKHDAAQHRKPTGHDAIFICGCGVEGCAIHTSITKR